MIDLRVEDSSEPLGDLRALLRRAEGYRASHRAERDRAAVARAAALPELDVRWAEILDTVQAGEAAQARELLAEEPRWALYARALGKIGLLERVDELLRSSIAPMPDRLYFTDSDEACALLARNPLALLIGFALDQQITVQKAFAGPLELKRRLGSLDAGTLAETDLAPIFREKPAIHRFPGSKAERVRELAAHVVEYYDGDAARIWTEAGDGEELKHRLEALPGYGPLTVGSVLAVLAKRFGVEAAREVAPDKPTLGDVDSPEALEAYQQAKRAHKAARRAGNA